VASATHINAAAPPTLVIFGTNDHLVPPDATDRFVQQARNAGISIESVRFPYGDHAFNLNQYGIGNQFYLGMTDQFLSAHGQRPANSTGTLKSLLEPQSRSFLRLSILSARLRWAARAELSPRQLKEVIQVAHTNVGSVASLDALVGGEVYR
jgi:acetyl esterase/lipase